MNFFKFSFRVQNLYKKLILVLLQGIKLAKEMPITYNDKICFSQINFPDHFAAHYTAGQK